MAEEQQPITAEDFLVPVDEGEKDETVNTEDESGEILCSWSYLLHAVLLTHSISLVELRRKH